MDVFSLANLIPLTDATAGRSDVVIGIIDGPVDSSHPALREADLRPVSSGAATCQTRESPACGHGTFITGILAASRDSEAPGISPGCAMLGRPIFCEAMDPGKCLRVTPADLASALWEVMDAGAKIINLSLGMADTALLDHPDLNEAYDHALQKGVIIVGASGNHGRVGRVALFNHPWVIPVVSCNLRGEVEGGANLGASVGKRGLTAPGVGITSLSNSGGYTKMSGTSAAAPFVTGAAALLWSLFPEASAAQIRRVLLRPGVHRRSVVPPRLDGGDSLRAMKSGAADPGPRIFQN